MAYGLIWAMVTTVNSEDGLYHVIVQWRVSVAGRPLLGVTPIGAARLVLSVTGAV